MAQIFRDQIPSCYPASSVSLLRETSQLYYQCVIPVKQN